MKLSSKFHSQPWFISSAGMASFMDTHAIDVSSIDLTIEDFFTPRQTMQITADAVAVISISGTLLNGAPAVFSKLFGDTDYAELREELSAASTATHVAGIFLDIDSSGGSAVGCSELFDFVSQIDKPVMAFCGGAACSAAYYIAAGADLIYAAPSAIVGCIGTVSTLYDCSEMLKKAGIEAVQFATGWMKGAGTDGVPMTDQQKEFMQDFVNQAGDKFKSAMTSARGLDAESMEGQHYWAENAPAGMVDEITTREEAYDALLAVIG